VKGCITSGTTQILIGLHRIGLFGLREALLETEASGLTERDAVTDRLIELLAANNYLPTAEADEFRLALWREYQRHLGEDIRDLYSRIEVVVRGEPGEARDTFVERLVSVFGDYELQPEVAFEPASPRGLNPQLVLGEDVVVEGLATRRAMKEGVRKRITDW